MTKRTQSKEQQKISGFTLIELLLYVSIVGSLLTAASMFFATTVDVRVKNQSITEVDQQGELAMEYIMQTIRGADSITTPTAGGTGALLTLVPTGTLSSTIIDRNVTTSQLQVKEGFADAIALTNDKVQISNLTIKNLTRSGTPGVVQVSFTISRVNPSGRNPYNYQKVFTSSAALRQP